MEIPEGEVTAYKLGEVPVFAYCLPRAPDNRLIVNVIDCHGPRGSLSGLLKRSLCRSVLGIFFC